MQQRHENDEEEKTISKRDVKATTTRQQSAAIRRFRVVCKQQRAHFTFNFLDENQHETDSDVQTRGSVNVKGDLTAGASERLFPWKLSGEQEGERKRHRLL